MANFDPNKWGKEKIESVARALDEQLQLAITEIITRTQRGKDVDGAGFVKYSEAYRKYKTKKGRTGTVDLTFTGNMLQSMQSQVEVLSNKIIGKIYFSSADAAEKAYHNQKLRYFFGLSKDQVRKILSKLSNIIKG